MSFSIGQINTQAATTIDQKNISSDPTNRATDLIFKIFNTIFYPFYWIYQQFPQCLTSQPIVIAPQKPLAESFITTAYTKPKTFIMMKAAIATMLLAGCAYSLSFMSQPVPPSFTPRILILGLTIFIMTNISLCISSPSKKATPISSNPMLKLNVFQSDHDPLKAESLDKYDPNWHSTSMFNVKSFEAVVIENPNYQDPKNKSRIQITQLD